MSLGLEVMQSAGQSVEHHMACSVLTSRDRNALHVDVLVILFFSIKRKVSLVAFLGQCEVDGAVMAQFHLLLPG